MEASARIQTLRAELNRHIHLYYVLDQAEITDEEYDQLFRELAELERQHPELDDANSPTKRVGSPSPTSFQKVRHERRMLSLDNAFTAKEVLDRLHEEEVVMEPKIDGLSLKLVYRQGRLIQAITRGDGQQGDDVTANARTIKTIPLVLLNDAVDLEVTGEVYMTYEVFQALNEELEAEGDDPFANVRNAASGTLKLKNSAEVAARRLSFVAHGSPNEIAGIETQQKLIEHFEGLGFQSVYVLPVLEECSTVAGVLHLTNATQLDAAIAQADLDRRFLSLATDGLVFKINNLVRQRELGEGTRSPNWAIAFKFPPERKATTLLDVVLQVGRTGKVTPVAELKPVRLSGTMVRRASLCNQDEIKRLKVDIGDEVYIEKSAEIIPKVKGLAQPGRNKLHLDSFFKFGKACPCCGSPLVRPEGFVDHYCENPDCEDQVFARLLHATGKHALDIDGCGQTMVRSLMDDGVRKLSDLFTIQEVTAKPAARKKFFEGREKAKMAPFWRKLHALGIEGVGTSMCQDIAARWSSLNAVFAEPVGDQPSELDKLKTVLGDVKFQNFITFVDKHAEELQRLDEIGFKLEAQAGSIGPLSGKVFVITGSLVSGTRDMVMRTIEKHGGTTKPSVTAKVHYLIAGTDGGAVKAAAAKKHGVSVISEEDLYAMIGTAMPVRVDAVDPNREY